MATESEHPLIIDNATGFSGGVPTIRLLINRAIIRFVVQSRKDPAELKSEVIMFNGLPDRGKSQVVDETEEKINTDPRLARLKAMGLEIPVKTIKIEHGLAAAKPESLEEMAERILPWRSGNYDQPDYEAGSKEFHNLFSQVLVEPGFYIGETVGIVGFKPDNSELVAGWDIGSQLTCDLAREVPPFQGKVNTSIAALDADDRVVARGKIKRLHREQGDLAEIAPTLGLYSRGDNLGGGVLDSVVKIEYLFRDILSRLVYQGIIPDSGDLHQNTWDFFRKYYREWIGIPEKRVFFGYNEFLETYDNNEQAA